MLNRSSIISRLERFQLWYKGLEHQFLTAALSRVINTKHKEQQSVTLFDLEVCNYAIIVNAQWMPRVGHL